MELRSESPRRRWTGLWPWAVLALAVVPAVWHAVDFPGEIDDEFPGVARPTFSRRPPPAYRLAEPGDTIDRVAIYCSAAAAVISGWGLASRRLRRQPAGLWPAALLLSLAAGWHAATPGPTFDGWHGLGWRAILDRQAPTTLRIVLASSALALAAGVSIILLRSRRARYSVPYEEAASDATGPDRGVLALLAIATVLVVLRQFDPPGVEPVGYWPRWAFVWGLIAFDLALLRLAPPLPTGWRRPAMLAGLAGAWLALVVGGIGLTWYHRPLERLRAVVPGKIYISAMPTYRGLQVAHGRHGFRTIINLFPEDTPLRSPRLPEELRFAREHGLRYLAANSDVLQSDAFLDETLRTARDPSAWPILVHCHGCMDRTPAWMGIYRFVVEGTPLAAILREIEAHRGYRPKASVTLLYNRVLPRLAPDRCAADPTARILRECARGVEDPYYAQYEAARANLWRPARVSRRDGPVRRP